MEEIREERLAEVFVELADTLVDDFDLIEFLQTVTMRAVEVAGVGAAGVLLADQRGRLQFAAASNEATRLLELFQLQRGEGPCFDAFRNRTPVVEPDLSAAATTWPRFVEHAERAGIRSVHALPLRLRREVIGALNLFGWEPGSLSAEQVRVVQALADIAAIGLIQERALRRAETLTTQLQSALTSRVVIEQAKGAIARTHGVGVDDAFELLRASARSSNRKLVDLARDVVEGGAAAWTTDSPQRD